MFIVYNADLKMLSDRVAYSLEEAAKMRPDASFGIYQLTLVNDNDVEASK